MTARNPRGPDIRVSRDIGCWPSIGLLILALGLLVGAFTSSGIWHFLALSVTSAITGWAATIFYEVSEVRIAPLKATLSYSSRHIKGDKLERTQAIFPLVALTSITLEPSGSGGSGANYRVLLGFQTGQTIAYTRAFLDRNIAQKQARRLYAGLKPFCPNLTLFQV